MQQPECAPTAWVCDLYRLSQTIAHQADPATVLQEILENIVERFDAGTGCLALCNPGERFLTLTAGLGLPGDAFGQRIEFGSGILGWVADSGEPLLLNGDLSQDPRFRDRVGERSGPRPVSAMCWPLFVKDQLVGVLSLNRRENDTPFSADDMERAELSVGMVTVVVENARLHREQQRQMDALAAANVRMVLLNEALARFLRSDLHEGDARVMEAFYRELLDDLRTVMQARHCVLAITDAAGVPVQLRVSTPVPEAVHKLADCPDLGALLVEACRNQTVQQFFPGSERDLHICLPEGVPSVRCLLVMPMTVNGRCRGALAVLDKVDAGRFDENDELVLSLFAHNLALLLERTELLHSLKHSNTALAREKAEQQALIGKLQEAQAQLLQSEKMASIGQLAAGVAHEINNPVGYVSSNLGSLEKYLADLIKVLEAYEAVEPLLGGGESRGNLTLLKQQVDMDFLKQDVRDLVRESQEGVKRVRQIVQDLKDFSHVDEAEWQWADLHKGLDSTLNVARNELKYKADVVKEYGELPPVECLASQLNQVFMNLLVNAAHAIEAHGTIWVRTGREDQQVWVEIEDTGKGIAPEHLQRIFDPFFTTKPVGKGTGLGLSLAYSIVNKHGGRIEVSSAVGKGTRFRVWLPVQQAQPRANAAVPAAAREVAG